MTMKCATLKPKMKEEVLERIDIEVELNNEGQDIKEKYLVMYRNFPDSYRIYPICGGKELAKGETNSILRYYISQITKGETNDYKKMTVIPIIDEGLVNEYKEV